MIRVERVSAPESFESEVRSPGREFLRRVPRPTNKEFQSHNYWVRVKSDLYNGFSGICAYSCHFIPRDTGSDTVEHFVPKSAQPTLAYEWANYRLVCGRLNGRKGNRQDVLDPFEIRDGIFTLDFPSLLIRPAENLTVELESAVLATITRLKLNDDETCVGSRLEYVLSYCRGYITFEYMRRKAPFLAMEMDRQNLVEQIREIMLFD